MLVTLPYPVRAGRSLECGTCYGHVLMMLDALFSQEGPDEMPD
jgi:hypothetical protein